MNCRKATVSEFQELWNYSETNTYNYFLSGLRNGNIEFLTIEEAGKLVSELYVFWNSSDKDEANGVSRAYLCALRVNKEFRGQGFSSILINKAKRLAKAKGYGELTIGIDNDDFERLSKIYHNWGFTKLVKESFIDLHYLDENNEPTIYDESYNLMLCKLD